MNSKDLSRLRNQPKEYITPDSYQIGTEVSALKKSALDLIDVMEKIINTHSLHVSKVRGNLGIRLVTRAVRVVLAYKDGTRSRSLEEKERRMVLSMVEEVLNGKRQAVQFQSTLDGNGILELFSNEVIQAGQDEILNYKTQGKT